MCLYLNYICDMLKLYLYSGLNCNWVGFNENYLLFCSSYQGANSQISNIILGIIILSWYHGATSHFSSDVGYMAWNCHLFSPLSSLLCFRPLFVLWFDQFSCNLSFPKVYICFFLRRNWTKLVKYISIINQIRTKYFCRSGNLMT